MDVALASERAPSCCVVEHTAAVEDYLKTIFGLSEQGQPASTSTLAERLGVAAPSVSAMLKRLEGGDLVAHTKRGQVMLTQHGRGHALRIVRRHRLLETFLARFLAVPWDEVHAEAEVLEHALSERLEERIDAALEHPARDPHGDPIPPRDGPHRENSDTPLAAATDGDEFLVARVSDRDSAALRYLAELGIRPGVRLVVGELAPFGGPLWVRLGARSHALGAPLVRLIHGHVSTPESKSPRR
jgi:DtxR family Mn-dependent transcriptional regulator